MKFICLLLLLFSSMVYASSQEVVEQFIHDQFEENHPESASDNESGELKSFFVTGEDRISIYWVYRVANFWESRGTLLKAGEAGYEQVTTLKIPGISKSVNLESGVPTIIYLDYAPEDARCCPTIKEIKEYKVTNSGYTEI